MAGAWNCPSVHIGRRWSGTCLDLTTSDGTPPPSTSIYPSLGMGSFQAPRDSDGLSTAVIARVDKGLCDPLKEERQYLKDTAHLGGKCLLPVPRPGLNASHQGNTDTHICVCMSHTHTHMPLCMFLCKDLVVHPCSNLYMYGVHTSEKL